VSSRAKAYLALTVTAVLWGACLPIIKPVFAYINPFQFLYFRYLLAGVIVLPLVVFYLIKFRPAVKDLLTIAALELVQIFSLILLYLGLNKTSAIEASLIGATDPIFLTLGGVLFLKERENKQELKGLLISFSGTVFLLLEPFLSGRNGGITLSFFGNLLLFAYLLAITAYYLLAKVCYRRYPKMMVSSFSYPVCLLTLFGLNRWFNYSVSLSFFNQPVVLITCAYMAVFGSIIAFTLYLYGQNLIEASEASLFTYLHIPFSLLTAFFLLKEVISWPQFFALIIIAWGVYLAEYRPRRYNR
jgi:drug/metabolite transporter (DMT)-like permease